MYKTIIETEIIKFICAYQNNLWYVYMLFLAYFHKLQNVAYENSLELKWK